MTPPRALRAVARLVFSLVGASVVVWALLPLAPGRPARRILLAQGVEEPTESEIARLEAELHLDRTLPEQFVAWAARVVRGDLSVSWSTGEPVRDLLAERLPATTLLAATAVLFALAIAVPSALVSAAFHRRWPDAVCRFAALVATAVPSFVLSLLALHVVVVSGGHGRVLSSGSVGDVWLPALVLAIGISATWARLLRATLLEALGASYALVMTARGASRRRLLVRHALPNALVPFLHAFGVSVGTLLGGATIVESVFSWPGVGRFVVDSVARRDLPVVQGFALLATVVYVLTSSAMDAVSRRLDPRIAEHR